VWDHGDVMKKGSLLAIAPEKKKGGEQARKGMAN
jgi:hypothetical protein